MTWYRHNQILYMKRKNILSLLLFIWTGEVYVYTLIMYIIFSFICIIYSYVGVHVCILYMLSVHI